MDRQKTLEAEAEATRQAELAELREARGSLEARLAEARAELGGPAGAAGVWFPRTRRAQNIAFVVVTLIILALTFVGTFMRGPYWQIYWPWETWPEIPTRL